MEITKEYINESKILNEGTTCFIMQHSTLTVYKLYKGALEYVLGTGIYNLDEKKTLDRLSYIISQKNNITLTKLPKSILMFNGKPVGVEILYYNNSISLKDYLLENDSNEQIVIIKQQVINIVEELIQNGIIPTDPHLSNFLISYNSDGSYNLNMIDMDDSYVSIYPNGKRDVWYESEVNACYRVIDLSFEEIMKNKKI